MLTMPTMPDDDPLMNAIVASPEDDAPRLVWADREGGERGELVVVQCRLARHDLSREERRLLTAREWELLRRHSEEWSPIPGLKKRSSLALARERAFVRGFLEAEAITLPVLADESNAEIFTRAPLLRGLEIHEEADEPEITQPSAAPPPPAKKKTPVDWHTVAAPMLTKVLHALPPNRISSIATRPAMRWANNGWTSLSYSDDWAKILGSAKPLYDSLVDLEITGGEMSFRGVNALGPLQSLERLSITGHFGADGSIELLRIFPKLQRIALIGNQPPLNGSELAFFLRAKPEISRLTELTIFASAIDDDDLTQLANCPNLSNLTKLHLSSGANPYRAGLTALAQSPHLANLTDLSLTGGIDNDSLSLLATASFAPKLRRLALQLNALNSDQSAATLITAFPNLEYLSVLGSRFPPLHLDQLRAVIPKFEA